MVVTKLEVWRGSGAGSKRFLVAKFNVPFKKVSLCFKGFISVIFYFIIYEMISFQFMIYQIQFHIPLRPFGVPS